MTETILQSTARRNARRAKRKRWNNFVRIMACLVVFITTYLMILPAITMESDVHCGMEEHIHTEECYAEAHTHGEACYVWESALVCTLPEYDHEPSEECTLISSVLTCGLEETEGHSHGPECFDEDDNLVCELPETEGHSHTAECFTETVSHTCEPTHIHTEECWQEKQILICTLPETEQEEDTPVLVCEQEEHTHGLACYSDPEADVETAEDWESTLPGLSGSWPTDLLAVAVSQLGYEESQDNYIVTGEDTIRGYTRYGAWFGDPYGNWNAMFLSFCLHYAGVPQGVVAPSSGGAGIAAQLQALGLFQDPGQTPYPGDILCLDTDGNGSADRVGVVRSAGDSIRVIEGDRGGGVREVSYSADSSAIVGYGVLPGYSIMTLEETIEDDQMEIDQDGQADTPTLDQYITGINVQHSTDGTGWEDITDSKIKLNDYLRFDIQYELDAGALNGGNTVTYQLPRNIDFQNAVSGEVLNSQQQTIGRYEISTDGVLTITFNDEYAEINKTQAITGHVAFNSSVSEIHSETPGQIHLSFRDGVPVDLEIEDYFEETSDLQVGKTATVDNQNGVVTYTVTVSSQNGTAEEVHLHDEMTNLFYKNLVSAKLNGNNTQNFQMLQAGTSVEMVLPKMNAGDTYEIVYTAELYYHDDLEKTVEAGNTVLATSKDTRGITIKDDAEVDVTFTNEMISKSGKVNDDGTISWTIQINQNGSRDMNGWVLQDVFNGEAFTGEVTISPAGGTSFQAALPYTFGTNAADTNTKSAYTITYITSGDKALGQDRITNEASVEPGDGRNGYTSGEIGIGDTKFNPLDKNATAIRTNEGGQTATVDWTVTIRADQGPISVNKDGYWLYTDSLWDGQWFTGVQLKAIKLALDEALEQNGLDLRYKIKVNLQQGTDGVGAEKEFDEIVDDGRYKVYKIFFYGELPKGKSFTYSYTSTAPVEGLSSNKTFRNQANINNVVFDGGSINYSPSTPTITKTGSASKDYHDLENGAIRWDMKLTVPAGYSGGDIILTENLPEGVDLTYFEILADGVFGVVDVTAPGEHKNLHNTGYSVTTAMDGQTVTMTIPEGLLKDERLKEIRFVVRAKILDKFEGWSTNAQGLKVHDFKNEVTISTTDGGFRAGDDHTTTITKNDNYNVLKKGNLNSNYDGKNVVPYFVVVNPDEKDLQPGADTLVLTDTLEYLTGDSPLTVYLVPDSVRAYACDADGNAYGSPLDIPYTYETKETTKDGRAYTTHILRMTIPDSTRLRIEYQYAALGAINSSRTFYNAVSLEGITTDPELSQDSIAVVVEDSAAGAEASGITLYKVDSRNYGVRLAGAVFALYKWDSTKNSYEAYPDGLTTGANGMLTLTMASSGNPDGLVYNTAYRLVEIAAPDGYYLDRTPYEFYIYNSDTQTYPRYIPDSFGGTVLTPGDLVYVPNEQSISVEKVWQDQEGNSITATASKVRVHLYRKTDGEPELCKTVELSQDNDWKHSFQGLEQTDENGNPCVYYVEEEKVSNYDTFYSSTDGIHSGVITVTNRVPESPEVVLPETGGLGPGGFTGGGLALLILGLLVVCLRKKTKAEADA